MFLSFRHNRFGAVGVLVLVFISFLTFSFAYGKEPNIGLIVGVLSGKDNYGTNILDTLEVEYTIIGPEDYGRLSEFDVVVIGVVAYDSNEDLKENHKEVLLYVK